MAEKKVVTLDNVEYIWERTIAKSVNSVTSEVYNTSEFVKVEFLGYEEQFGLRIVVETENTIYRLNDVNPDIYTKFYRHRSIEESEKLFKMPEELK
jgi:hypothetical protein